MIKPVLTMADDSWINVGDIIILQDDNYLHNIVTDVTKTTLGVRKQKWHEDRDTKYLIPFIGFGLLTITAILAG